MFQRIRTTIRETRGRYPSQFWLLFWGMLLNAAGGSMVWPFLTIYVRQQLDVPLTQVGLLLSVNSLAGFVGMSFAGPAADRFGRKGVMVLSLAAGAVGMLAMSRAASYSAWVAIMLFTGAFNPLYRVGADAMVADLVGPAERPGAYALLRMIANLGVAIGPALGGFITSVSYAIAFYISALASTGYALLLAFRARETLPASAPEAPQTGRGYAPVLRDRPFVAFVGIYGLAGMAYVMMMVLLPVYAKENFGVPESQYGFIMATNAAMVVLFQYAVTRRTSRRAALPVLAVGSLFFAAGVGAVALSSAFLGFWLSMVVLTIGEMIVIPTSTTLTANLAPADMRGRYMGIYTIAWGMAFGIGPVLGGALNDNIGPAAIWYGAALLAAAAAVGFLILRRERRLQGAQPAPAT
ncbi:MAG TPA: MFS transporter [Anaerolineales bacterium]|nr:MFS transporter [Anaerolineales bacterium]